jgi:hypothetical protein
MSRFQVGDIVVVDGRLAHIVWLRENASEIEAMDEYIVEFEDKQKRFIISSALQSKQTKGINDRKTYSDCCQR